MSRPVAARLLAPLAVVAALAPWLAFAGAPEPACPVEPLPLERLNVAIAAATPTTEEVAVPSGVRGANAHEVAALRRTVEAFVACSDAGEPLRVLSLYTDRYLGELYYRQGRVTEQQYASLSRPDPADVDERTRLLSVAGVEVLADGRVTGAVTIRYAVIPTPKRFLVTVAGSGGGWRIDDILGELTFALP